MAPDAARQHIPLSRRDVVVRLLADAQVGGDADGIAPQSGLHGLFELLQAIYHFQFHQRLEATKAAYAPFNPDRNGPVEKASGQELTRSAHRLADELSQVLEAASYHAIPQDVIQTAFRSQALFRVSMTVDFTAFEELLIYARGRTVKEVQLPRRFRRRPRVVEVESYDRVCLYVRFKAAGQLTERQRRQLPYPPGSMLLKLFRNIPLADLEMLFPNCQVRLRLSDKLVLGVPALVGGVPVLIKLIPLLLGLGVLLGISRQQPTYEASTVAAVTALIMLVLYLFQQWNKIKNRRVLFLKLLSENLYFRNLDNNEGVLTRLVDEAEEEGCKEAMLVYALALAQGVPATTAELTRAARGWLGRHTADPFDLDVQRGVERLIELGLLERTGDDRLQAVPVETGLVRLDARWDDFFPYANRSRVASAEAVASQRPPG